MGNDVLQISTAWLFRNNGSESEANSLKLPQLGPAFSHFQDEKNYDPNFSLPPRPMLSTPMRRGLIEQQFDPFLATTEWGSMATLRDRIRDDSLSTADFLRLLECISSGVSSNPSKYLSSAGEMPDIVQETFCDFLLGYTYDDHLTHWCNGVNEAQVDAGIGYMPVRVADLVPFAKGLKFTADDIIYDFGAGLGRSTALLSLMTPAHVIGIENVNERFAVAQRVLSGAGMQRAEVILGDVRTADFSNGTAFYMFNPFFEEVLRSVLDRIAEIAEQRPVRILTNEMFWDIGAHRRSDGEHWLKPGAVRQSFVSSMPRSDMACSSNMAELEREQPMHGLTFSF